LRGCAGPSPAGATAGGTAAYTVYTDAGRTTQYAGHQPSGTVTVAGGIVPDSSNVTLDASGTSYWKAVYDGDANNN
jgi:hypothetical protein